MKSSRLIPIVAGLAIGAQSAFACYLTLSLPCAKGWKTGGPCPYPNASAKWSDTVSDGNSINTCPAQAAGVHGFGNCANEAQVQCVQTVVYTPCPGGQPGSGSMSITTTPQHGINPGC